jgi:hypothetical protein
MPFGTPDGLAARTLNCTFLLPAQPHSLHDLAFPKRIVDAYLEDENIKLSDRQPRPFRLSLISNSRINHGEF